MMFDEEFMQFLQNHIPEELADPEMQEMLVHADKVGQTYLSNPQMRKLKEENQRNEAAMEFDPVYVEKALSTEIIHDSIMRILWEMGIPSWGKQYAIKLALMNFAKADSEDEHKELSYDQTGVLTTDEIAARLTQEQRDFINAECGKELTDETYDEIFEPVRFGRAGHMMSRRNFMVATGNRCVWQRNIIVIPSHFP